MARDYLITYNGFQVGGSTARQIDGEVRRTLDNTFETTVIEFDFITTATTDAAFATECLACENAFRIPRQDFTFTQASQTLESLKPLLPEIPAIPEDPLSITSDLNSEDPRTTPALLAGDSARSRYPTLPAVSVPSLWTACIRRFPVTAPTSSI